MASMENGDLSLGHDFNFKILLFLISSGLQFLHFILLDSFSFIIQFFFLLFRLHAQSSTDVMLQVQVKTHQWLIPTFLIQQPWKKILVKNYIGFEAHHNLTCEMHFRVFVVTYQCKILTSFYKDISSFFVILFHNW